MPEKWELRQMQALPLEAKIVKTKLRIREWYEHFDGKVYVAFSGGKDSTVLSHLVHECYPEVPLVFCNTGLEYPEIQSFARKMDAMFVRPKMRFDEVISTYGYPIIGKEVAETIHGARNIQNGQKGKRKGTGTPKTNKNGEWLGWRRKSLQGLPPFDRGMYVRTKWYALAQETQFNISEKCCNVMKKAPLHDFQTENNCLPYIGTLTEESLRREKTWLKRGCNAFEGKSKTSQPMSFWTEQDVLHYIKEKEIEIASVYGEVVAVDKNGYQYEPMQGIDCELKCTECQRTGCIFCGFGAHLEKGETRFQRLAKTHPRQYEYCIGGGQWVDNPNYDPTAPKYDGEWKNWNPKQIWVPSKKGLGMGFVFDQCNQIYGKDFLRYD